MNVVSNPINAFRMIKRLTNAWKDIEDQMRNDNADEFLNNVSTNVLAKFPKDEDLAGAAIGIMRLQDTYRLDTHDLANGFVNGHRISKPLTGNQSF